MLSCGSADWTERSSLRFAVPLRLDEGVALSRFCDDEADQRHSQNTPPATRMIMIASTYQKALLRALAVSAGDAFTDAAGAGAPPCASRGATPSPATENFTGACAARFFTKKT